MKSWIWIRRTACANRLRKTGADTKSKSTAGGVWCLYPFLMARPNQKGREALSNGRAINIRYTRRALLIPPWCGRCSKISEKVGRSAYAHFVHVVAWGSNSSRSNGIFVPQREHVP